MNKQDKLWYLIALFIVGIATYEFGAKGVTSLETVQNDYSSTTHGFFTIVFTLGLCISCYSILTVYFDVKHHLNTVTNKEAKEEK